MMQSRFAGTGSDIGSNHQTMNHIICLYNVHIP